MYKFTTTIAVAALTVATQAYAGDLSDQGLADPVVIHPVCLGPAVDYPGYAGTQGVMYDMEDYLFSFISDGEQTIHYRCSFDRELISAVIINHPDLGGYPTGDSEEENSSGDGSDSEGCDDSEEDDQDEPEDNGSKCNNGNGNGNEGCSPGQGHGANDDEGGV